MVKKEFVLVNNLGLHSRAAALFVQLTNNYVAEINIIKEASEINENALVNSVKTISNSKAFGDILDKFKNTVNESNACYDHLIIFNNGLGITDSGSYIVHDNIVTGFDSAVVYNNYFSDTGLTLFFHKHDKKDYEIYKKLFDVMQSGINIIKPGTSCSEVFKAMENKKNYYNFENILFEGHGIGLNLREYPIISSNLDYIYNNSFKNINADFLLEENMVFNIETPILYLNDKSYQIEKTFIVTKNGFEDFNFQKREEPICI